MFQLPFILINQNNSGFDPAKVSTTLWLTDQDLTTITKDMSDVVSEWRDKSGNGNHFTVPATYTGPVYTANGIQFGIGILLQKTSGSFSRAGAFTQYFVVSHPTPTISTFDFYWADSASSRKEGISTANTYFNRVVSSPYSRTPWPVGADEPVIIRTRRNASNQIYSRFNDDAEVLLGTESGTSTFNRLGGDNTATPAYWTNGHIRTAILLDSDAVADGNDDNFISYLMNLYGL